MRIPNSPSLLIITALACSSSSSSDPAGGNPLDGGDAVAAEDAGAPDVGPSACDSLRVALQAAVDGARKSPNAVVAVSTADCPSIVVASGDAATGGEGSLWRFASVTKTYVSATILSLAKDGKLTLEDELSKWVPNVPNTAGVTIRMLLNHTSGIFNFNDDPAFTRTVAWTPTQLVEMATSHAPYFAPGAGFRYSNTDYVLLGLVAEAAGGGKLGALLHQRAIDKAKLGATFFSGEDTLVGTPARGFDSGVDITETMLSYATWAAGSMVGSAADGAEWMRKLYSTNEVLDADQRTALTQDAVAAGLGQKYGLGVQIYDSFYKGEKAMGHRGDTTGFHTWAFWFPNRNIAFVAIVNEEGAKVESIAFRALDVLLK
jgi:D-alanyl-D-alanine carboxypeptidase